MSDPTLAPLLPEPTPPPLPAPEDVPLPAHRVALRVALLAPSTGCATTTITVLVASLLEGPPPGVEAFLGVLFLGSLALSGYSALLVLSEELARRVPRRRLRPLAIGAMGAGAPLVAAALVVWAMAIYEGKGADGALRELGRLVQGVRTDLRETVQLLLIALVPFLLLGTCRSLVARARQPGWSALLAVVGGLLAGALGAAFEGLPSGRFLVNSLVIIVCAAAAGGFALGLGERLEARVLTRVERWREERGRR